ncbi:MAG TPA: hypothetical protein VFC14_14815 [Burkholderiales bacterium]|jgi:hypothetical protein|nr:hypothetical protein [Burkholderiales bacterium]
MPSREEIEALRAGAPLPAHRIIPLRSKGMHSIRFEFVVRLLRTSLTVDTLSIYWERGHEFLLKQTVEDAKRRLVLGRINSVVGEFPDLWLLCYPEDEEIKQLVEQEIERMIAQVRAQHSGEPKDGNP